MDLAVQKREKFGHAVKSLRREGLIPAELYGHDIENIHLSVAEKDFLAVFKEAGTNTVINVSVDGKEKLPVLIHVVKRDYLDNGFEHIDFYKIRMDEKTTAMVPVEFLGDAPAVKEYGGILNKSMSEIEVEALPANLPHRLSVDLSVLDSLNKSVYIKDISVPKGVEILIDPETVIATVTEPLAEEEKVEEKVDVGDVKVESEEKKKEKETEKASDGAEGEKKKE